MPSGRPWYQRNPADFIMAVRGWDLEMVGAYSLIIDHLNDRDRALPNDDKFMAGLLNCSTKRWRKIRDFLLADEKLILTADDYLTNPRFEREHAARYRTREEAVEHGRAGGLISAAKRAGQTELDLDAPTSRARMRTERAHTPAQTNPETAEVSQKFGQNFCKTSAPSLPEPDTKTVKNQSRKPTPPSSSVRAQESRVKRRVSSHPTNSATRTHASAPARESAPPPSLANADLRTLYSQVCDAAGFNPRQPPAIERAMSQVEKWRDLGVDFDTVVLPAIRSLVIATADPTRTLARFDSHVRHEHAKLKAAAANGETYVPPEIPHLNPEGEDPAFLPLRTDLLDRLGPLTYANILNDVTFEAVEHGDKRPLRVNGMAHIVGIVVEGRHSPEILDAARKAGFTALWKGR